MEVLFPVHLGMLFILAGLLDRLTRRVCILVDRAHDGVRGPSRFGAELILSALCTRGLN